MAYKAMGRMDYFEGRGAAYFAGYCSYCGKKHYLMPGEAKRFVDEAQCYFARARINPLKIMFLPKPDIVPADIPAVKEKTINIKMFNVKYQDRGGLDWLKTGDYKLREIAEHYGFSVEYARRVRDAI